MACNGRNHPPDCKCNFRGGHPNSHPPAPYAWGRRSFRKLSSGPNAKCPQCFADVYFIKFRHGGTYFNTTTPPLEKHECTDGSRTYKPFNKRGVPKLRNRKSDLEKDGWLPFFATNIEKFTCGTIIHGLALDSPTIHHFGFSQFIDIESDSLIYFKILRTTEPNVKLHCFLKTPSESANFLGYNNCSTELELRIKINSTD